MPGHVPGRATTRTGGALVEVTYRHDGDDDVVVLAGELDASTGPIVEPLLTALSHDGGDVHVDLSGVTFLDVRGLHLLDETAHVLRSHGGRLIVDHSSRAVRRLCKIARDSHLELADGFTIDDAGCAGGRAASRAIP